MFTYILRRLMAALPVIVGAIAVVFILTSVVPGDPAQLMVGQRGDPATIQKLREDLGLNRPLWQQFVDFFKGVMTLDLGRSYRSKMPVTQAIAERLPVTARLALGSMALAVVSGVTLGMLAALKQNSVLDYGSMIAALIGISAPSFWVGSMLIFLFCVQLRWVPGTGTGDGSWIYMLLPVLTLGMRPAALIARLTRCGMLEVLGQDFIRTARAKGLAERAVIIGHALKNAMLPVVTLW